MIEIIIKHIIINNRIYNKIIKYVQPGMVLSTECEILTGDKGPKSKPKGLSVIFVIRNRAGKMTIVNLH